MNRRVLIAIGWALLIGLMTIYAYLALTVAEDQSSGLQEQIRRGHDGLVVPKEQP